MNIEAVLNISIFVLLVACLIGTLYNYNNTCPHCGGSGEKDGCICPSCGGSGLK